MWHVNFYHGDTSVAIGSYLKVRKGQVTFDSEGNDNKKSKYYSRKPHVPGRWSGVTIGRGYDLGQKSKKQIIKDLTGAGVSKELATKLAEGAKLKGQQARNFLKVCCRYFFFEETTPLCLLSIASFSYEHVLQSL